MRSFRATTETINFMRERGLQAHLAEESLEKIMDLENFQLHAQGRPVLELSPLASNRLMDVYDYFLDDSLADSLMDEFSYRLASEVRNFIENKCSSNGEVRIDVLVSDVGYLSVEIDIDIGGVAERIQTTIGHTYLGQLVNQSPFPSELLDWLVQRESPLFDEEIRTRFCQVSLLSWLRNYGKLPESDWVLVQDAVMWLTEKENISFESWLSKIEEFTRGGSGGFGLKDFPEYDFSKLFEKRVSPKSAYQSYFADVILEVSRNLY